MPRFVRDNGLTLALFLLFAGSFVGQSFTGRAQYNQDEKDHGRREVTYGEYITSAAFAESVFENWESEFLQMTLYVWLTSFLYQRGSAESKDPDEPAEVDEEPELHRSDSKAPAPVRAGGLMLKLYQNSLLIALLSLFLITFGLHWVGSYGLACHEGALHGESCSTLFAHIGTSTFWFESLQNWQSEFLSIGVLVVLSIFLRQKGSPESKPVHAPHSKTGK